jgi:PilZ domain
MQEAKHRRAPRVSTALSGSLLGREPEPVVVLDLSLTGCLVRCRSLLDRGAIRDLRLALGDQSLTAKVRVQEASLDGAAPPGEEARFLTGLEFLALPAQEALRLRVFLDAARRSGSPGAGYR